ncbi:MAG: CPBP family intramembrane metalloprotease [Candidatus Riflebacteria bacterium]|nr:CPBP family intramembrane metalloprotease [Candidatus Riflebacteria bacterium]
MSMRDLTWEQLASDTHLGRYFLKTREPAYSLLFLLPLILAYEILALVINVHHTVEVRNGADVILREILAVLRIDSLPQALVVASVVILIGLTAHRKGHEPLKPAFFAGMFVESCIWGFFIGAISRRLLKIFFMANPGQAHDFATKMMLFLGAGVYEELVFRVLLIGFFLLVFRRVFRFDEISAATLSVLTAALLFSLFHHVGPFGEPFRIAPFLFRFFAGLVLSVLYVARGLGIAAWSHALYDIFLYLGLS